MENKDKCFFAAFIWAEAAKVFAGMSGRQTFLETLNKNLGVNMEEVKTAILTRLVMKSDNTRFQLLPQSDKLNLIRLTKQSFIGSGINDKDANLFLNYIAHEIGT